MNHRLTTVLLLVVIYASLAACWLRADVKMPAIFGDHMVLQQEATLPVWGWADPGENVTVTVGTESASATAGADGKWMVKLPPLPNGSPATTMTVKGKNTLTFSDVLVGDVWICSGQSNMVYGLGSAYNHATAVPQANDPQLRLFFVPNRPSITPQDDMPTHATPNSTNFVGGAWMVCTPTTAQSFSAVGYFFGQDLRKRLNRPIGMIQSAWNGTWAQAWTSLDTFKKDPAFAPYIKAHDDGVARVQANPNYAAQMTAWQAAHADWMKNTWMPYINSQNAWNVADAKAKAAGQPEPPAPVKPNNEPRPPQDPSGGPGGPSNLYNGMIAPLIPYAIKGVIWYQGESNGFGGPEALEYHKLFPAMITGWRDAWGQGNFPFLYVELASYNLGPQLFWPYLRESQQKTLTLANTGMASAVDLGDFANLGNIHPHDKQDVGLRLSLAAMHVAYGQNLVYSGPMFGSAQTEGNSIRVHFTQTGGGLVIGAPPWIDPKAPAWPKDKLTGFQIAGADGNYVPADAKIDGDSVVVSSPQVPQPVYVRFGWSNVVITNLYNKEGLPASPFRTDNKLPWEEPKLAAPAPAPPPMNTGSPLSTTNTAPKP